jgi:hypothetical protein
MERAELRERVVSRGHVIVPGTFLDEFRVAPPADVIMTVAVDEDPTLREELRNRYYLINFDNWRSLSALCSNKVGWREWLKIVVSTAEGPHRDFLGGPGAWLLARLQRSAEACFWRFPAHGGTGCEGEVLDWDVAWADVSRIQRFRAFWNAMAMKPQTLTLMNLDFVTLLAGSIASVEETSCDCCVASYDYREVFCIHHHEKIVCSIPDLARRKRIERQMTKRPDLFSRANGY